MGVKLGRLKEAVMARRLSFSERIGLKEIQVGFQKEGMSRELKNRLWTVVGNNYWGEMSMERTASRQWYINCPGGMAYLVWDGFWKNRANSLPGSIDGMLHRFEQDYNKLTWNEVYDYIEFIAQAEVNNRHGSVSRWKTFCLQCNKVLEDEMSAYRFVDGVITPIVDDVSIVSIEDAINKSSGGASEHVKKALQLYSQRPTPDYSNSVKESISAVEALAKNITNDPKATLGKAFGELKRQGVDIHPALLSGFQSIYGWTSDEGGIRHGMMNLEHVGEEDARVMLVMCSAFVNYLMVKGGLSS